MVPKKLYQTLFVLQKSSKVITRVFDRIATIQDNSVNIAAKMDELVDHSNLLLLELSIFLEEYNNEFLKVEEVYKERVMDCRQVCSPIMKMIKKWKDLPKFRNYFIAHNFRDRDGEFKIPDFAVYDVPRNPLELYLAQSYINYIMLIVASEFKSELANANRYILANLPSPKPKKDYSKINRELLAMQELVNGKGKALSKSYTIKVQQLHISGNQ